MINRNTCNEKTAKTTGLWRKGWQQAARKTMVWTLSGTLLMSAALAIPGGPLTLQQVEAASVAQVQMINEQFITAGARLRDYVWTSDRGGKKVTAKAQVIIVDLANPYVNLDAITGQQGKLATRNAVINMAQESGAVGGINGDYYNMSGEGAPIGPQIVDGELISTPSQLQGLYAFGITSENRPVIGQFTFSGTLTTQNGATHPITGINKSYYWTEPDAMHSHVNALYIYTSDWGSQNRANDGNTTPTEVLVQNGVVTQIAVDAQLPLTPPEDGYILRATHEAAQFVLQNIKVGDTLNADYRLQALDASATGSTDAFKMMVGGHTLLVDNGQPVAFTRNVSSLSPNSGRSRTAIGYNKDNQHVYLIAVEKSSVSSGMTLAELQMFMTQIGVHRGLNLDGGGSTQLVSRPLGETGLVLNNLPEDGSARRVVNGIGVFTTAPVGALKDMILSGSSTLLLGERSDYQLKAYDEYYNPLDGSALAATWSLKDGLGQFDGATLTAQSAGSTQVVATSQGVQRTKDIEIVGRKQVSSLRFAAGDQSLQVGKSYTLPLELVTKSGIKKSVPAESVIWEFKGFTADRSGGTFTVTAVDDPQKNGYVIARYDGLSTMLTLSAGSHTRKWLDFDQTPPQVSFSFYPQEVTGVAQVVGGWGGLPADNRSLKLDYQFASGTGTKAAYADLGGEQGLVVAGEPFAMALQVWGDNSANWLRVELIDGNGKKQVVDITRNLNWTGWKAVSIDLAASQLVYPISVKRLYVASPESGQSERAASGSVAFDDLSFTYSGERATTPTVKLTVDRTTMTVNGQERKLDQSPVVLDGRTFVPVRFVIDALSGHIDWNNPEKKVTAQRGSQLIQLWIGERGVNVGGTLHESDVAPQVINNRTMIPLRLISEAFGWQVHWEESTRTITLSE